jgi:hypothetical protein
MNGKLGREKGIVSALNERMLRQELTEHPYLNQLIPTNFCPHPKKEK